MATAKETNNNLAEVEKTFAECLMSDPTISGLFTRLNVSVFCVSSESAETLLKRKIMGGLGTCVFIDAGTIEEVAQNKNATAIVRVDISVRAPDIVAEPYIASSDIAMAIVSRLHGTRWSAPFDESSIVLFTGLTSSNDSGAVVRDLTFSARVNLLWEEF